MDLKNNNSELKIITIPNILSFFRLCLIPIIVWLYLTKENSVWAGYVLILSGATDIIDGFIARKFHMISNLGKVLDPLADKLTQAAMLICLFMHFPPMIFPFLLMLIKEVYMGVSGFIVIQKTGVVLGAEWHGKAATALLYAMMLFHIFWIKTSGAISNVFIAACTVMIAVSLVLYVIRNTKALKRG